MALQILAREDESKKMIEISVSFLTFASSSQAVCINLAVLLPYCNPHMQVNVYPNATKNEGQNDLSKVDVLLNAEIQRLEAVLDAVFLGNIAVISTLPAQPWMHVCTKCVLVPSL